MDYFQTDLTAFNLVAEPKVEIVKTSTIKSGNGRKFYWTDKVRKNMRGKKRTKSWSNKIIATKRKNGTLKHSAASRAKISANSARKGPWKGKRLSKAHRLKVSIAVRKANPSRMKGKRHSPETIAKMKATWARKRKERNKGL